MTASSFALQDPSWPSLHILDVDIKKYFLYLLLLILYFRRLKEITGRIAADMGFGSKLLP
jgi:hypothetical protein